MLNYLWHQWEWPPVEWLAGAQDIVHAAHPLLIPASKAAQVVTVHDLFFLTEPDRTRAEVRRDYAALAPGHARRAHAVVTSTHHTAGLVIRSFGVPSDRVHVCAPGPPAWRTLGRRPNLPANGYVLFVGTLEPRKNIGVLLDAYERLLGRGRAVAPLVLAGRTTPDSTIWTERIAAEPLAGHVRHLGYVPEAERERLYAGAKLLVLASRDEGFGLPVLEAMSAGVPVVASDRGSLPEVLGDAGMLVEADDVDGLAAAIERMLDDEAFARECATRGLTRAQLFSWDRSAVALKAAYQSAFAIRQRRHAR